MEVLKMTGVLSRGGVVLLAVLAQASLATKGINSAATRNSRSEFRAHIGRATLTVEDLKTLLGQSTRDPSSQAGVQKHEVSNPANPLKITLDSTSAHRLAKILAQLEIERAEYEKKLTSESNQKIEKLRADRKKIQASRISSSREKEEHLSRELFDSFLSEANSKAKIEESLREFDQSHSITIDFVENSESRSVQRIFVGSDVAWAANGWSNTSFAQK